MNLIKWILGIFLLMGLTWTSTAKKPVMEHDYDQLWKKADSLNDIRQPAAAIEIVDEIYRLAKKENNVPVIVRAQLFRLKLSSEFEQDYLVQAVERIRDDINNAEPPERQMLHSVLGELYVKYFEFNRYKILNRTATAGLETTDIEVWDVNRIMQEAAKHFQLSLEEPAALKKISIQKYRAILENTEGSMALRPTLFDFLAWRAVEFYLNEETDYRVRLTGFIPDDGKYFEPAGKFIKMDLAANFEESHTRSAMKILQALLQYHLNDKNPVALIDADLKRLEIMHNKSVFPDKDKAYLNALENMRVAYKYADASAEVAFRMAKFHQSRADKYSPLVSDDYKWENQKAVSICEETIKAFPTADGAQNCLVLLDRIKENSFNITLESAVIPGMPALGLLSWKNFSNIYFRLVKMDYDAYAELTRQSRHSGMVAELMKQKVVESWSLSLPDNQDYQRHSLEFKIPEVEEGFYVLLASNQENFKGEKAIVSWADFWSTNLSLISQRLEQGGYDIFVLDRGSGKPRPEVVIEMYKREYNYRNRQYEINHLNTYLTDENGFLHIGADNDIRGGIYVELVDGKDLYRPEQNFYFSKPGEQAEKTVEKTFFFTDRSIYRPGQLVYFKGIVLEKTGDKYEVKSGAGTTVELYDANNQKVSTLELTSNDYGSVNGSFTIPSGLLNGAMRIKNKSGSCTIHVEEYKRPNFEVNFEPVRGSYKLNEEVTLTGAAKAYAENNIDNAIVKYRVVRNAYYPWFTGNRYGYMPYSSPPVEIAVGEAETDEDGIFTISFDAVPDYTMGTGMKQSFSFRVTADVTDVNGETQSGDISVHVGSEAMLLDINIPENVNRKTASDFIFSAQNLNGEKLEAEINIKVYKLQQPSELIIDRYWAEPDQFSMSETEFRGLFPNRVYKNEVDPKMMERDVVFEMPANTAQDSLFPAEFFKNRDQGMYLVEMTGTDVFGTEVKTEKVFTLFEPEAKRPPVETYLYFEPLTTRCEPGENAKLLIGSSVKNASILYEFQYKGETIKREWLELNNQQHLIEFPITEAYRGNVTFHYRFVNSNRVYEGAQIIEVPYTNKKLDLAFETMRSELEPGGLEKWIVTISDREGEKVAAEMLASMYDASLDAFLLHSWNLDLYRLYNNINAWNTGNEFTVENARIYQPDQGMAPRYLYKQYYRLNWFGLSNWGSYMMRDKAGGAKGVQTLELAPAANEMAGEPAQVDGTEMEVSEMIVPPTKQDTEEQTAADGFQLRRDFNETAFFYPELRTNESGNVVFEFTLPESFTRWKFMGLAHTRDLMTGLLHQEFTAAKKLMVIPNAPRFFREGDSLNLSAKITNLSDENLDGRAVLEFFDAVTMEDITSEILVESADKRFRVEAGKSEQVSWKLVIPGNTGVVTYRMKAKTLNFSDGVEKSIPVLPNRMMVTEAMPMNIRGNQTKTFTFEPPVAGGDSETMENYRLTLEFASNPAWYAVQALPVISDAKYNNAVSVFNAFFAKSIAFQITNQNPEIERVFENWKTETPDSFLSKLEKNQELKQILLEQTPWVLNAKDQKERHQRLALLFDLNNMQNQLDNSIRLLEQFQTSNGGFRWMNEMRESRYVTQLIVLGMGKLHHMGVIDAISDKRIERMLTSAVRYLDQAIDEDFKKLQKRFAGEELEENHLSTSHIQYLYARSFFGHIMLNPGFENAVNYYKHQASKFWTSQNNYLQGMIALALHRDGKPEVPELIVASLRDRALEDEETGMFWRGDRGFLWYEAPIETQALMIEVFDEVAADLAAVEEMKVWLLKQKQTQDWKTSRATADAVYALLMKGSPLLANTEPVEIAVGGKEITRDEMGQVEAGTGYFQTSWDGPEIEPDMASVLVTNPGDGIAWGAMYRQYFEDLDKITQHETGLSVQKQLFVKRNTRDGQKIAPVNEGEQLAIGDQLMVRIEIRVDRNMEFVHLRDLRAAAFEPANVLSGYRYQSGLGYYQTTKDASTDFFFDFLPRGTWVFEYPLIVSQTGNFSNGITTIQCMYAPEFVSHSGGVRVVVNP